MYCFYYPSQVGTKIIMSYMIYQSLKKLRIGKKLQVVVLFDSIVEAKLQIGKKFPIAKAKPCFNVKA
jgi:hypothetical protein